MTTQVILVDQATVYAWRSTVEQLLRGVVFTSPTLYTIDDLFVQLRNGGKQLWVFLDDDEPFLFGITRIAEYPQGKMLVIGPVAGRRFKAGVDFLPRLELWGKMQGAICVHAEVAEKMKRVMEKRGYAASAYAMYKSLMVYQ